MDRRKFMEKSLLLGAAGMVAPSIMGLNEAKATPRMTKDDISIGQWGWVEEVRKGVWRSLDFPMGAREDLDINGIDCVNTLLDVPTKSCLNQPKRNAH